MNTLKVTITRGDDKEFLLKFFDELNEPLNIRDNYDSLFLDISSRPDRQTEEFKFNLGFGMSFVDNHIIKVSLNYNQTQFLYQKTYWGDLKAIKNAVVTTFFRIEFNVIQSTTKI